MLLSSKFLHDFHKHCPSKILNSVETLSFLSHTDNTLSLSPFLFLLKSTVLFSELSWKTTKPEVNTFRTFQFKAVEETTKHNLIAEPSFLLQFLTLRGETKKREDNHLVVFRQGPAAAVIDVRPTQSNRIRYPSQEPPSIIRHIPSVGSHTLKSPARATRRISVLSMRTPRCSNSGTPAVLLRRRPIPHGNRITAQNPATSTLYSSAAMQHNGRALQSCRHCKPPHNSHHSRNTGTINQSINQSISRNFNCINQSINQSLVNLNWVLAPCWSIGARNGLVHQKLVFFLVLVAGNGSKGLPATGASHERWRRAPLGRVRRPSPWLALKSLRPRSHYSPVQFNASQDHEIYILIPFWCQWNSVVVYRRISWNCMWNSWPMATESSCPSTLNFATLYLDKIKLFFFG
jgi:hypothetical protein